MYPSLTTFRGDLFADFDAFQRQLDRVFGWGAVNVGATEDAVEIYAFAPGLDPAKIDVSVDKGLLSLTGERADDTPADSEKVNVYARERFAGAFRRVISLPDDADPSRIDASYRNGVLRILVPKLEARKPRRVEVKPLENTK